MLQVIKHNYVVIMPVSRVGIVLERLQGMYVYMSRVSGSFSVLYFNSRSLLPKMDVLRATCAVYSPDCVCVVETWLSKDISDSEVGIDGFSTIRLDRNRHGGGVLIYVKSSFFTHYFVHWLRRLRTCYCFCM